MTPNAAFFYGTLMLPAVLHRVCHGSSNPEQWQKSLFTTHPAVLHHHQRHRIKEADYPAILPCDEPDTCVRGSYVSGLSDEDLWRLDIFEGKEYERRMVKVKILDEAFGETDDAEAETYVWIADEGQLEKREWEFDEFVREKIQNWVASEAQSGRRAIRPSYREVDEAVKSRQEGLTGEGGGIMNEGVARSLDGHNKMSPEFSNADSLKLTSRNTAQLEEE